MIKPARLIRWETADGKERGEAWISGGQVEGDIPEPRPGARVRVYSRTEVAYVWAWVTRTRFSYLDMVAIVLITRLVIDFLHL